MVRRKPILMIILMITILIISISSGIETCQAQDPDAIYATDYNGVWELKPTPPGFPPVGPPVTPVRIDDGSVTLSTPYGVTVDHSTGTVYFVASHAVYSLTPPWPATPVQVDDGVTLQYPEGISFDPNTGDLYVADSGIGVVRLMPPFPCTPAQQFIVNSPTPGPTWDVSVDSATGELYVVTAMPTAVYRLLPPFPPAGAPAVPYQIDNPYLIVLYGVSVDPLTGVVYAADWVRGIFQLTPILPGFPPVGPPVTPNQINFGGLNMPYDVSVYPTTGVVYVANWNVPHGVYSLTPPWPATPVRIDDGTMLVNTFGVAYYSSPSVPYTPTAQTIDVSGNIREDFLTSENIYVTGSGFPPGVPVNIHIVNDRTWTIGDPILSDVSSDGINSVITDASGNIGKTLVWPQPTVIGEYDIIFDVNPNNQYDAGDFVDNPHDPGFSIVGFNPGSTVVGGFYVPVNNFAILLPYLALAIMAIAISAVLVKRNGFKV